MDAAILITAMAREKQSGAVYNANGSRLEQLGGPPRLVEPVQATLRIQGATTAAVRPLDVYGVPKEKVDHSAMSHTSFQEDSASSIRFDFRPPSALESYD